MLSGQYDLLVNNMWLTDIISVILLIIPIFLIFYDKKWLFGYYVISIVANLPLIFVMSFHFSYEIIIIFAIIVSLFKDLISTRTIKYTTTRESMYLIFFLVLLLGINLLTSFFHFNEAEMVMRLIIYIVNIFILIAFTYFLKNKDSLEIVKMGFIIGSIILVSSMVLEMLYGYYVLNVANMRPAGLLLDPNVCAFALNLALIISFFKTKSTSPEKDIFIFLSRIIIIFGVFLTVSRSAYISTVVILGMYLLYYSKGKRRWMAISTVVVFVLMYAIFYNTVNNFVRTIYNIIDLDRIFPTSYPTTPSGPPSPGNVIVEPEYTNSRITLLISAFKIFKNNFIYGVGIGNVVPEINNISGMKMNAHNLILQLLDESGIVMLLAILTFVFFALRFILKTNRKGKFFISLIFIVVFIESLFNHNLLNINIIWLVLAFLIAVNVIYSKEQKVYSLSSETLRRKNYNKKVYR